VEVERGVAPGQRGGEKGAGSISKLTTKSTEKGQNTPQNGGSKLSQIYKVGCHLPPFRAAVAGLGAAIYISFIIYFNCCRPLTDITSTSHPRIAGYPCIHEAPRKRLPAPSP